MEKLGIHVETHHHEVATAGQAEIDMRFNSLVAMADNLMWYKYIIKNVARRYNKTVTFMPKPAIQRQRQRHARAPEPVEGRSAVVRRRRLCRG